MKQYIYNDISTMIALDTRGVEIPIKKGYIISATSNDDMFVYGSRFFKLDKDILKGSFLRVYTEDEQNRFDRIHEQTMVAAVQGMIAHGWHKLERDTIAQNAIDFADALIEKLMERDF